MIRLLGGLALASIISVSALAQNYEPGFPGCVKCAVYAWVDGPTRGSTVSRAEIAAHRTGFPGWGLECVSGHAIDRIDIYRERTDGSWQPLKQPADALSAGSVPRPDVVLMYAQYCPGVYSYGLYSGWEYYPTNLPLGAARYKLVPSYGPYHANPDTAPGLILTLNVIE